MSSGRTHTTVSLIAAGTVGTVLYYNNVDFVGGVTMVGGILTSAFFFSPDWDVDNGYLGYHFARKVGIGWLYQKFLKPYALAFKHRSFWSHWPVFSTLIRLLYLFCPPMVLIVKDQSSTSRLELIPHVLLATFLAAGFWLLGYLILLFQLETYAIWYVGGLVIGDVLHSLMDLI